MKLQERVDDVIKNHKNASDDLIVKKVYESYIKSMVPNRKIVSPLADISALTFLNLIEDGTLPKADSIRRSIKR